MTFILGDYNALCYECGRKKKASTLKKHWRGYYVCANHWEPRQPQDFVRGSIDVQQPDWTQPSPKDVFVDDGLPVPVPYVPPGFNDPTT